MRYKAGQRMHHARLGRCTFLGYRKAGPAGQSHIVRLDSTGRTGGVSRAYLRPQVTAIIARAGY